MSLHHQPWFLPSDHHSPWRKNAKPLRSLKSGSLGADVGDRREWWAERLSTNYLYMMGIIWNMIAKGWRILLGNIPIILVIPLFGIWWEWFGIWGYDWGATVGATNWVSKNTWLFRIGSIPACFEGPEISEAPHFLAFATGRLGLRDRDGSIVCLLLTSRGYWFLWDVWGSYRLT